MSTYSNPFSKQYWLDAAAEVKSLRKLTFAALMMAICLMLSYIPSVPLIGSSKLTWGFLGRSVCAMVCGPVMGLAFGCAEDLLSFFMTGGGGYPFFPGYTLTTMLGMFFYSLFLYRARVTVRRVFLAKLVTNIQNVLLGTLWSSILYGKAFWVLAGSNAIKNAIMLPVQTLLLVLLFSAVMPVLNKMKLVPAENKGRLPW